MIDKDPENLTSSTFCALPWMHISTRPNRHIRVCCTQDIRRMEV